MVLNTQLLAIKMSPKILLQPQLPYPLEIYKYLNKTVTFFYNFCLHEPILLKFQILVVKVCNDLTFISKIPKW